jgi:hypothetical protein
MTPHQVFGPSMVNILRRCLLFSIAFFAFGQLAIVTPMHLLDGKRVMNETSDCHWHMSC